MAGDVDHGDFAPTSARRAEPAAAPDESNSALSATTPLDLERAHLETPRKIERPSREEAEAAVRTLLRWTRDDPARDGMLDTPGRVVRAWEDWFSGYNDDPADMLARPFEIGRASCRESGCQ